jgi:hypothetical protein
MSRDDDADADAEGEESGSAEGEESGSAEGEESEWRYGIDDVGPDADGPAEREPEPVEPGQPRAENVLFFVLGVLVALFSFYALLF